MCQCRGGDSVGGVISDKILDRTGNVRLARLSVTVAGFAGALLSLFPILFVHDITIVALCLSAGFFCADAVEVNKNNKAIENRITTPGERPPSGGRVFGSTSAP